MKETNVPDLEKIIPKKWSYWWLSRKAKKFYESKIKYIKRYKKDLNEISTKELTDKFEALKQARKIRPKDKEQLRNAFCDVYSAMNNYLPKALNRPFLEFIEVLVSAFIIVFVLRAFIMDTYHIPTGSMIPTIMPGDRIFASKFIYGFSIPWMNVKFAYFHKPTRGDIVIFEPPLQRDLKFPGNAGTSDNFVKRLIGLNGDSIQMIDQQIYINGQPIERKLVDENFTFKDSRGDYWINYPAKLYAEKIGDRSYKTVNILPKQTDRAYFGVDSTGKISFDKDEITGPYIVPEGYFFVIGDNRDGSNDSRYWGPISLDNIKGAPMIIWLSVIDGSLEFGRFFNIFYQK